MLYNPKWDVETRADPFTVRPFVEWLETTPKAKKYDFGNISSCLVAQYLTSKGFRKVNCNPLGFYHSDGHTPLPSFFNTIANGRPWTFGAALERARALLP